MFTINKFLRVFAAGILAAASFGHACIGAAAAVADDIVSEAALLMDAKTGQVLFQKRGEEQMFPASMTKIVTGLLAAERLTMEEIAEVTESAVNIEEWNSSNIALSPGERLPVDSLMYGLMLPSANDAANVLAEHIAGNQRDFAQLMTERARQAGATNTRFANAHGLHDPRHYTTALDMARITRDAINNPVFMQYFGAATHTIPATNLQPEERPFTNYQYMLVDTTDHYDPRVFGGKVGYTNEARHTMSTAATQDGRTLICVVMSSEGRNDKFRDTALLLDFGFDEFYGITIPKEELKGLETEITEGGKKTADIRFEAEEDFTALLHESVEESAVTQKLSREGPFDAAEEPKVTLELTAAQQNAAIPARLGEISLAASITEVVPEEPEPEPPPPEPEPVRLWQRPWFIPAVAGAVILLTAVIAIAARHAEMERRRKRRRERIAQLR
jgi:D-alanyl-D-alanine carboxypeptidase (penicillin-binding protein 5/6)